MPEPEQPEARSTLPMKSQLLAFDKTATGKSPTALAHLKTKRAVDFNSQLNVDLMRKKYEDEKVSQLLQ